MSNYHFFYQSRESAAYARHAEREGIDADVVGPCDEGWYVACDGANGFLVWRGPLDVRMIFETAA